MMKKKGEGLLSIKTETRVKHTREAERQERCFVYWYRTVWVEEKKSEFSLLFSPFWCIPFTGTAKGEMLRNFVCLMQCRLRFHPFASSNQPEIVSLFLG